MTIPKTQWSGTDAELRLKVAQLCGCSVDDVANIERHSDGSVMVDVANRGGHRYFAAKALTEVTLVAAPAVVAPVASSPREAFDRGHLGDVERVVADLAPSKLPTRAPHIKRVA